MGCLQRKIQSGLRDSKLRQILHHGPSLIGKLLGSSEGADTKDTDMAVQVGVGESSCGIWWRSTGYPYQPGLEDWREII